MFKLHCSGLSILLTLKQLSNQKEIEKNGIEIHDSLDQKNTEATIIRSQQISKMAERKQILHSTRPKTDQKILEQAREKHYLNHINTTIENHSKWKDRSNNKKLSTTFDTNRL